MKVEIDTSNKTIKVLEECKIMDLLNTFRDLDDYKEYKIIPNTIINTIKIKDIKPLDWVQPYSRPWVGDPPPYTKPAIWYGTENTIISSTNINQTK